MKSWETGVPGVGPGPRLEGLNWVLLVCFKDLKNFSGLRIVTSPFLPTFEMLSILFTLQRIVPGAYKSWDGLEAYRPKTMLFVTIANYLLLKFLLR